MLVVEAPAETAEPENSRDGENPDSVASWARSHDTACATGTGSRQGFRSGLRACRAALPAVAESGIAFAVRTTRATCVVVAHFTVQTTKVLESWKLGRFTPVGDHVGILLGTRDEWTRRDEQQNDDAQEWGRRPHPPTLLLILLRLRFWGLLRLWGLFWFRLRSFGRKILVEDPGDAWKKEVA